eukprot:10119243-Lingulodinium_polyedra.AAC.1
MGSGCHGTHLRAHRRVSCPPAQPEDPGEPRAECGAEARQGPHRPGEGEARPRRSEEPRAPGPGRGYQ